MKCKSLFALLLMCSLRVTSPMFIAGTTAVALVGCGSLKPAPIEAGQDAVVVNAERVQNSSLAIFEQVTQWEFDNRATLPAEVSRAIDVYRKEFPPAWKTSRKALADYKAKVGPDATALEKATAALSVAQGALLQLKLGQSESDVLQANNAITKLINAISVLFTKTPAPVVP